MLRLQMTDSKIFTKMSRSREISFARIWCSAHQVERLAATMLLAGCNSLCIIAASVPRGCNCASRFTSSQSHRGCNAFGRLQFRYALSLRQCLATAIVPRRRKKVCSASIQTARQAGGVMNPVGLQTRFRRITNHAGTHTDHLGHWNSSRMRTAGEGGYSPVFASRAAVPHPAAVDRRSAPALYAA